MKPAIFALALSLAALTALPVGLAEDDAAPTLVEVQPTPEDRDEWVEFANPTPVDAPLEGLYLTDRDACFAPGEGFVDTYRWSLANVTVPAQDRLVVDLPDEGNCLNLADTSDELVLEDEEGNVLQSVSYGEDGTHAVPTTAESLSACHLGAHAHGSWALAQATPGQHNPGCSLAS